VKRLRELPPLRGLLPLVVLLVVWQLVQHGIDPYYPRPSLWWKSLSAAWNVGVLRPGVTATVKTFVLGLVLATAAGTILGALVGRSRVVDRALGPTLEYCRVLPPAAVVPIVVLFTGYTEQMKLAVVVFTAIWPVLLQVRTAARTINPVVLELAQVLRLGRARTLAKIVFPSLVPGVVAGVRLAAPVVLIITLLVEAVTQVRGIGSLLQNAQRNYDSAQVYGLIVITGVLALLVNWLVELATLGLRKYQPDRG
jgi:ABC-type nitrate/sulfonate/bicarbonate transport system permease component